jgi:hypothetical protein
MRTRDFAVVLLALASVGRASAQDAPLGTRLRALCEGARPDFTAWIRAVAADTEAEAVAALAQAKWIQATRSGGRRAGIVTERRGGPALLWALSEGPGMFPAEVHALYSGESRTARQFGERAADLPLFLFPQVCDELAEVEFSNLLKGYIREVTWKGLPATEAEARVELDGKNARGLRSYTVRFTLLKSGFMVRELELAVENNGSYAMLTEVEPSTLRDRPEPRLFTRP